MMQYQQSYATRMPIPQVRVSIPAVPLAFWPLPRLHQYVALHHCINMLHADMQMQKRAQTAASSDELQGPRSNHPLMRRNSSHPVQASCHLLLSKHTKSTLMPLCLPHDASCSAKLLQALCRTTEAAGACKTWLLITYHPTARTPLEGRQPESDGISAATCNHQQGQYCYAYLSQVRSGSDGERILCVRGEPLCVSTHASSYADGRPPRQHHHTGKPGEGINHATMLQQAAS
jgi:hypothetical protein